MMTLSKYGLREWLGIGVIAALFVIVLTALGGQQWTGFYLVAFLVFIIWLAIALFFRNPKRIIPEDEDLLLSPADGVIKDIEILEEHDYAEHFSNKPVKRIGIFLSVLNVHLNRMPCKATVDKVVYKEGCFHDARSPKTILENESNSLLCTATANGKEFPIVLKQISGAIARKIVCPVREGQSFEAGEIFGMIKFGSRTELYIPADLDVKLIVSLEEAIKAGCSIVGQVK